jgi:hypothetical protein
MGYQIRNGDSILGRGVERNSENDIYCRCSKPINVRDGVALDLDKGCSSVPWSVARSEQPCSVEHEDMLNKGSGWTARRPSIEGPMEVGGNDPMAGLGLFACFSAGCAFGQEKEKRNRLGRELGRKRTKGRAGLTVTGLPAPGHSTIAVDFRPARSMDRGARPFPRRNGP